MELSKRLTAVANLVTPGSRLADVGTDHGYLPIFLVKEGKVPWAVAMDVNEGPLQRAREHILKEGLQEKIRVRQSDGLRNMAPGEVDCAVIAGMGGALTIRILSEGWPQVNGLKELILQPQSEVASVRFWVTAHGLTIAGEDLVEEDGKFYPMMRLLMGKAETLTETQLLYGPCLLRQKHPVLVAFLQREYDRKQKILTSLKEVHTEEGRKRRFQVMRDLYLNREAFVAITGESKETVTD